MATLMRLRSSMVMMNLSRRALHTTASLRQDRPHETEEYMRKEDSAREKDYITRAERQLMKNLVNRLESKEDNKAATASLETLLKKHNVKSNDSLVKDLLAWRAQH